MTGWTPLFQQIIGSSIWGAENHIRIAWITLLAVANKDGIASVTAGGLARLANISPTEAAEALQVLSSPDPDTLTQEHEGRRIERCETGWRLLNFVRYRDQAKKAIIREQNRLAQQAYRDKKNAEDEDETVENEVETQTSQSEIHPMSMEVIVYLNERTGRKFSGSVPDLKRISARLNEKDVTLDGVKKMIDRQVALWTHKPDMVEYLRPETLFRRSKFDGYYSARDLPVPGQEQADLKIVGPGSVPNNGF